jgi:hypothetical protein
MKDTYCKRIYECKCGILEYYVWQSKLKETKFKCNCGDTIGFKQLKPKQVIQVASIRTETKNR